MKVLQSWLRQFVPFRLPPEEVARNLGMLGLETAGIERPGRNVEGFVVGQVLEKSKHPNADRLSVCTVDVGSEILTIVCGAPNVEAGQKVPVGLIGATVPKSRENDGQAPFVLSRVKIRGIESAGMICSEDELCLGKDADGIMVLDREAKVGETLARYFGLDDVMYDVEITPNRPDWLSHIGVAREIGVFAGRRIRIPRARVVEGKTPIGRFLSVSVEDRENCPRFAARMVRGVRIGPSPLWMQNALRKVGLRPRNNVVDVTNYVMMECGQPLHAFDFALLRGGKIIVRRASAGTAFRTLDGKEHRLPDGTVMVCDAEREVSVAGVMGGENSEISDQTVDVVLEAAYWNPASIRRTAKALGISSDASQRFERGTDPNGIPHALDRAAELTRELAGGEVAKGVIDRYPGKIRQRVIPLRTRRLNEILGTSLSDQQVIRALGALEISKVKKRGEAMLFRVPTFRVDISREIDLIEEVARVHGYNKIEERTSATVDFTQPFPRDPAASEAREALIGMGFQEAVTNSMQDERHARLSGVDPVHILNPQNQEMAVLRTSLVPGLLDCARINISRGNQDLRLFEVGHVFSVDRTDVPKLVGDYREEERMCLLMTGRAASRHWSRPDRIADIFDLKGEVEGFLRKMALDKCRFISYSTSNGLTDSALAVENHGGYAGYLGRISDSVRKQFDIEQEVFVAELALPSKVMRKERAYQQLPRFPKVKRDVAFTVNAGTSAEALETAMRGAAGGLLHSLELFDLYQGEPLPAGKKSMAFSLEFMSREKTLTEQEIEAAVVEIVRGAEQLPGVALRGLT